MSDEHFTVDCTFIEAWASQKSFRKKDGGDSCEGPDFHSEKQTHDTTLPRPIRTASYTARAAARKPS